MPTSYEALSKFALFAGLPPEEIENLAATLRPVVVQPGELLFREDEPGGWLYVVVEGEVEVVKALATPEERVLDVHGPGEFFGEMSLLNPDGLRTASVRARSSACLLEMSRADFDALLGRQPSTAYQLARVLSARLRMLDNAVILDLQEKNRRITEAYQALQAAQAQVVEKEKLERELNVARRIQQSILPNSLPEFPGFDFGARMVPALLVGGDLFDFVPISRTKLGVVIGDVSDKGVPAAIFMALTRSLIRAEGSRTTSPRRAVESVNRHLLDMNDSGMFVTALYGVLDRVTRQFVYARAGHEPPIVVDESGEVLPVARGHSLPLGLFDEPALDEQIVRLPPGGTLLLYTDGVTDARGPDEVFFGLDRLRSLVRAHRRAPAQALCDRILQSVIEHSGRRMQDDDITLVAVAVR